MLSTEGEKQLLRMGPCRGSGFEMGLGVGETQRLQCQCSVDFLH